MKKYKLTEIGLKDLRVELSWIKNFVRCLKDESSEELTTRYKLRIKEINNILKNVEIINPTVKIGLESLTTEALNKRKELIIEGISKSKRIAEKARTALEGLSDHFYSSSTDKEVIENIITSYEEYSKYHSDLALEQHKEERERRGIK